jgi:EAL domain-containing protein (putative c-di-GMP-specific phosphodiesterase class I)
LKIDRCFVAGAPRHNRDSIIIRSAIGLARELGMEVVAEGVEIAEQCYSLLAAGSNMARASCSVGRSTRSKLSASCASA